jgi:enoyl-[acyl-carrier-protein] reductase (NADH)
MGEASDRSITWAIAQSLSDQGARLAFTYENERVESRIRKLAETLPGSVILPCDVTVDHDIDALAAELEERTIFVSMSFRQGTDTAEVGDTAMFLMSHLSRGMTGEVIYVDEEIISSAVNVHAKLTSCRAR